jgi:drug/metabolite transporter (DMT)-like permease
VTYVSIFEYSMLIFASTTAWVLFGDRLGPLGFVGIGVIIITGIVIAVRSNAAEN